MVADDGWVADYTKTNKTIKMLLCQRSSIVSSRSPMHLSPGLNERLQASTESNGQATIYTHKFFLVEQSVYSLVLSCSPKNSEFFQNKVDCLRGKREDEWSQMSREKH